MPHVLHPGEIDASSPVGGKARALARMTDADLPVPEWFVVLPSAFHASAPQALSDSLRDANLDPRDLVASVCLAADVLAEVSRAVAELAPEGGVLAVRSSASDEDSARLSFAGQLESFLFVEPDAVATKIVAVWASGFSERLMRYRREAGLDALAGIPAVIVQRMVDGDTSGVAFSADPVSGRLGIAVVAAVPGLGSALVSGEAAADTWRVDRTGNIVERIVEVKPLMHRRNSSSPEGVTSVVTPLARQSAPALDDTQVRAVAALARSAEAYFSRPQDIEWTLEGEHLYLLQSRPVTTLADKADPDARRMLWDNSNIIESYSGVTTPLTFSFARKAYEHVYREFCRLVKVPEGVIEARSDMFSCMLGLVRGRVYYNLFNWYRLVSVLPGYRFNRRFMEQMMGVSTALPENLAAAQDQPGKGARVLDAMRLAWTMLSFAFNVLTLERRMQRFYARLRDTLGERRPDLSGLRADELVIHYRQLEQRLLNQWDAPIVNDFATMIFHGLLRRLSSTWAGDTHDTLHNDLLCAEKGMVSQEPAVRVRAMARLASADEALVRRLCEGNVPSMRRALRGHPALEAEVAAYLERFGDRCMEELKLESPTLHDDPSPLLRAVGQYASDLARHDARASEAAEQHVRESAERRVHAALARRPLRRLLFGWVLANARARMRARENLRLERTRVFGRARQIAVELGRRYAAIDCLEDARDVFYLEVEEMLGFVEGRATTIDLKGLARVRKAEFAAWEQMPAPADRFETTGIPYRGNDFGGTEKTILAPGESTLKGLGCCPGIVRGPVRLVRNPRTAIVKPGEILVAERTDPGWVMIFPSASGLLVERGSLLSHSAIVARELGLPTIVSLPGLTRWLGDGDWVEMDGSTGIVVRVSVPASAAEASRG